MSKETPLFSLASRRQGRAPWLAVIGPGLIAMLADTEAGSIIAAVQSEPNGATGWLPFSFCSCRCSSKRRCSPLF